MKGQWRRSGLHTHIRGIRRPQLEGLEARRLLTSSISGTNVVALAGQDTTLDVANFRSDSTLDFASAMINWGDKTPATSGVINQPVSASAAASKGDITGDHTYSQPGTYTIVVTAQEIGSAVSGNSATVTSTAIVSGVINPGPVLSPTVVQGVAFSGLTVATFTTSLPGATAHDFSAMIDWGDPSGTTSPGTIVPAAVPLVSPAAGTVSSSASTTVIPTPIPFPESAFAVTGGYTYAPAGNYVAKITISDGSSDSVTTEADFTVSSGPLVAVPITAPFQAIAGETYTQIPVGGFIDLSPNATPGSAVGYLATIDWGDGTTSTGDIEPNVVAAPAPATSATAATPAAIVTPIAAAYSVTGSHMYSDAQSIDTITTTITDPAKDSVSETRTVDVSPLSITAQGQDVTVAAGDGNTPLIVASFTTSPPSAKVAPGDYTATIGWGDGSSSTGQVIIAALEPPVGPNEPQDTSTPGGSPNIAIDSYIVEGEHAYAAAGTDPITVMITGPGGASAQTTSTATVTVSTLSITAEGQDVTVAAGDGNTPLIVASFTTSPPSAAAVAPGDYTATIGWGDGSSSTGQVFFAVLDPPGGPIEPQASSIAVPSPVYGPRYFVEGEHAYAAAGSDPITVMITGPGGASAQTTSTATVTVSTLSITAQGQDVTVAAGDGNTPLIVASFTTNPPSAAAAPGDYTATIGWGDGSSSTGQVIIAALKPPVGPIEPQDTSTPGGSPNIAIDSYIVEGEHAYAAAGTDPITVTITGPGGASAQTTSTATVTVSTLSITAEGQDVTVAAGDGNTPLIVASFTTNSPSAAAAPGDYTATIGWGDGSSSTGQVFFAVLDPPGGPIEPQASSIAVPSPVYGPRYFVEGEHAYAQVGTDPITVTITGPGGASAMTTSTATVTSPSSQGQAQGVSFSATTNQPATDQTVASFPAAGPDDSPSNYTATIDWGDGTTTDPDITTGTISSELFFLGSTGSGGGADPAAPPTAQSGGNGGDVIPVPPIFLDQFVVSGTHTYAMHGTYPVTVVISDLKSNVVATTTSTATVSDDTITAYPLLVSAQPNQPDATLAVAGFNDSAELPASDFTVSIDWGDGTPTDPDITTGTVESGPFAVPLSGATSTSDPTVATNGPGQAGSPPGSSPTALRVYWGSPCVVFGQHGYSAAPCAYTITVTITSTLGAQASVSTTAKVTAATPTPPPQPFPIVTPVISIPILTPTPTPSSVPPTPPVVISVPPAVIVTPPTDDPSTSSQGAPTTSTVVPTPPAQPAVIVGASHPGKAKKHHVPAKVPLVKLGHGKASPHVSAAARGKHKPA